MKVTIFGMSIVLGGFWGIAAFWCVFLELVGIGSVPYDLVDQLCLGLLSPTFFGAILGSIFGFGMGVGSGIIGGFVYNIIAAFTSE